jgi:hypothetical protein
MKIAGKTITILIITMLLAFGTSLFFELPIIQNHWTRKALVIILMLLELLFGFAAVFIIGKNLKK